MSATKIKRRSFLKGLMAAAAAPVALKAKATPPRNKLNAGDEIIKRMAEDTQFLCSTGSCINTTSDFI